MRLCTLLIFSMNAVTFGVDPFVFIICGLDSASISNDLPRIWRYISNTINETYLFTNVKQSNDTKSNTWKIYTKMYERGVAHHGRLRLICFSYKSFAASYRVRKMRHETYRGCSRNKGGPRSGMVPIASFPTIFTPIIPSRAVASRSCENCVAKAVHSEAFRNMMIVCLILSALFSSYLLWSKNRGWFRPI